MTKHSISELAIFSGKPSFQNKLYVGRPNIGNRESFMARLNDMLDRRWLTNDGQYVQELESNIAEMIGVKHCITMCNATIALEIVIRALGLEGEVIIPSFTFVATAHSLQWQQITPVFCDIDPLTHNIDPNCIEKMITPRTSGIIGVHVWGRPCDTEALNKIATKHNIKLLYDAAHAFACTHGNRMIGTFGDAEVFSFHATKFFNTFEGGAVVTNNDDLAKRIRLMKNFGFAGNDNVIYVGTNGKMTEVSAAMGLSSLESLDEFISINHRNYNHYKQELAEVAGLNLIQYDETEKANYQYIILELDDNFIGIDRDQLVNILHAENIFARRYFYPGCHQMEPYRSFFPHARLLLPHTESVSKRVISLPNGTAVTPAEISLICDIIRLSVKNGIELNDKLKSTGN